MTKNIGRITYFQHGFMQQIIQTEVLQEIIDGENSGIFWEPITIGIFADKVRKWDTITLVELGDNLFIEYVEKR